MKSTPRSKSKPRPRPDEGGRLKIGDDWNAIRIIALSQSNPLKAIAEFVENSIDAHAKNVTITRGREHGEHYLAVKDDGDGVPRDAEGLPDFRYVATHICDSVKRHLKAEGNGSGASGRVRDRVALLLDSRRDAYMSSTGADKRAYQMIMSKGDPRYTVSPRRALFSERGTELRMSPLLEGIRTLSGEKIQWYLASELRDRIRHSGVRVTVVDKVARKQYEVEPRQFEGRLLHQLSAGAHGLWRCLRRALSHRARRYLPRGAHPQSARESSRTWRTSQGSSIRRGPRDTCRASSTCLFSI